ncbi:MAG: hypothetical protein ABI887_03035 [Burkholderiales bacterium]
MLALLVAVSLLAAVAGGLLRAGSNWSLLQGKSVVAQAASAHAALMLSGFLGMVIAIERAVAVRLRWAFGAPVAAGLGSLALLAGRFDVAAALGIVAALVSVGVHLVVMQRQRAPHSALLLLASCAWLVGNVLFAVGGGPIDALPWWFLLPVLTIAAERLEMTRLTRRHAVAMPVLLVIVALLLAGAALAPQGAGGGVLFGGALVALALWFGTFDIARRTLFSQGLPRYMAVCLLAGYAWLALAGLAWMGVALGCPGRDLALHALGLGFIFSMVMGHAPVILPAVLRVKLLFGPWFYAPLLALHASLLLRGFGGIRLPTLRTTGAELNATALLLFAATLIVSALLWRIRRKP